MRLAHEALLTRWPTLAALIAEHRDFLAARRRLHRDAANWERSGRHDDFLLPPGRRLAEAEEIVARRRAELEPESVAYAEASSEKARAAAEAAERAKEAALRRELKRSRRVAAIVSLLLVAAIGAGAYAWRLRGVATTALGEVEVEYQAALNQAAGSVTLLVDGADNGSLSTDLMRRLVERSRDTVTGLPGQSDAATAAQVKLLNALSVAYLSLSGVAAAQEMAVKANALADALVAKDGSNAAWARLRLEARGRRADAENAAGDSDAALADAREAQAAALALAGATVSAAAPAGVDSPENELAVAYQRVGDLNRARGAFDDARVAYQAWRDRAAALRAAQPNETLWLRNEMFAIQRLGDLALSGGATTPAMALFTDYLSRAEAFAAARPADAIGVEALAGAHQRLGDAALASGDAETAEREYLALQTYAERLIGFDSANFRWREFVAVAWQRLGSARLARQDPTAALADFETYRSPIADACRQGRRQRRGALRRRQRRRESRRRLTRAGSPRRSARRLSGRRRGDGGARRRPSAERHLAPKPGDQPPAARRSVDGVGRPRRRGRAVPRLSGRRRSGDELGAARPVAARRRRLLPARARGRAVTAFRLARASALAVVVASLVAASVGAAAVCQRRRGRRADAEDENDRRKQDAHGRLPVRNFPATTRVILGGGARAPSTGGS